MLASLALTLLLSTGGPDGPAPPCTAATLRSEPLAKEEAAATGNVSVRNPRSFRLVGAMRFAGPCARAIRATSMGQVLLSDGQVFEQAGPDRVYSARPNKGVWQDEYDGRTAAQKSLPLLRGTVPLWTDRVDWPGLFVGVWKTGRTWVVASFHLGKDGRLTTPEILLSSDRPLRSASYFPAPDTNAGLLELVQAQDDGSLLALAFAWNHD